MTDFGRDVGLIPRELLERGHQIRHELYRLDERILDKERELQKSRSRLRALLKQETGVTDGVGLTRGKVPGARERREDEEEYFDQVKADLEELLREREQLVSTIRPELAVVPVTPSALDLREPTKQL